MELDNGKISKVQDKWNGKLPDNTLLNVNHPIAALNCSSFEGQMP
jgi:hypothetical protein